VYFNRSKSLGEDATLYSVPASGGSPTAIHKDTVSSDTFVEITGIAADPAGGRVVFADITDVPSANLPVCRVVAVELATGKTTVLLSRVGGFGNTLAVAWHVTWSPDGSRLLVSQAGQDAEGGQTCILTLADGSVRALGVLNAANADWSADGASVIASIDGQRGTSIKLVSLSGKVIRTLAIGGGWTGPPAVYGARFSPDGGRVAYAKGPSQLWLMNANGSGKLKLTKGAEPAWR
jgi:Tol biopolymer transport system component